ncbi:MAG: AAA family ATPase [bacterium]|nr:AAA family ATPase [bacterium]
MITSFSIGNFKAFGAPQCVPIKPITLIYGANSAGKSSIIHAMLLSQHALKTGEWDTQKTTLGGDAVDLGGFTQFSHKHALKEPLEISFSLDSATTASILYNGRKNDGSTLTVTLAVALALDDKGRPAVNAVPSIQSYQITTADRVLVRMSKRKDNLRIDSVGFDNDVFAEASASKEHSSLFTTFGRLADDLSATEGAQPTQRLDWRQVKIIEALSPATLNRLINSLINAALPECEVRIRHSLPCELRFFRNITAHGLDRNDALQKLAEGHLPSGLSRTQKEFILQTVEDCLRRISGIVETVVHEIQSALSALMYLGPLRSCPDRHLVFPQTRDNNWYAAGGYAWDVLRENGQVRKRVNDWLAAPDRLQTRYELVVRRFVETSSIESVLYQQMEDSQTTVDEHQVVSSDKSDASTKHARLVMLYVELDKLQIEHAFVQNMLSELKTRWATLYKESHSVDACLTEMMPKVTLDQCKGKDLKEIRKLIEGIALPIRENIPKITELLQRRDQLLHELASMEQREAELSKQSEGLFQSQKKLRETIQEHSYDHLHNHPQPRWSQDTESASRDFAKAIRDANIEYLDELVMIDRHKGAGTIVTHREVGVGISQVLPVLVTAYASDNKTIAIEQPEIHLHPALQADLGDLFIGSALGPSQNRFFIETHSEHLLLRIMKRMRQTAAGKLPEGILPVTPKDVCVLFVERDGSRSIVREMPLNERGELVKAWPGGFFEEGLREVF